MIKWRLPDYSSSGFDHSDPIQHLNQNTHTAAQAGRSPLPVFAFTVFPNFFRLFRPSSYNCCYLGWLLARLFFSPRHPRALNSPGTSPLGTVSQPGFGPNLSTDHGVLRPVVKNQSLRRDKNRRLVASWYFAHSIDLQSQNMLYHPLLPQLTSRFTFRILLPPALIFKCFHALHFSLMEFALTSSIKDIDFTRSRCCRAAHAARARRIQARCLPYLPPKTPTIANTMTSAQKAGTVFPKGMKQRSSTVAESLPVPLHALRLHILPMGYKSRATSGGCRYFLP